MGHEISTAVAARIPAVWVVLNDARYGMIDEGLAALGGPPLATELPPTDFAVLARGLGAEAIVVTHEAALDGALRAALAAPGPFVVDVRLDRSERAPLGRRIANLVDQGAGVPAAEGAAPP
jgi:acetolactate synthase-1/2/3 large subunit